MKFTPLSLAFLAALVTAEHLHQRPHHFHLRRHLNTTSTSAEESTTLTVFQTLIRTITSCAATVTDCPARSATEVGVVTEVIALTTTVCPVTAAAAVSSSLAVVASSTGSVGPASSIIKIPLRTSVMEPEAPASTGGSGTQDTTLTYTLGTGSSTTVITTTIKRTATSTEYFTQYITRSQAAAATESGLGEQSGGETNSMAAGSEPTTTITQSSTVTKYVTVKRASTAASVSPFIGVIAGSTGSGDGACVPQTVTVALSTLTVPQTVTIAMSTVTVTYTPMGESPSAAPPAAQSTSSTVEAQNAAVTTAGSTSLAPYGNGTAPTTKPVGTRFLTKLKSTTVMGGY